jgi:sialate O-acetylesterase
MIRNYFISILLFSLILSGCLSTANKSGNSINSNNKIKISIIGDSITEGFLLANSARDNYTAQLQLMLGTVNYEILNFGATSMSMMKNVPDLKSYWNTVQWKKAKSSSPDIFIINLGLNDAKAYNWKKGNNNFINSYIDMIDQCRQNTPDALIFICYPTACYHPHDMSIDQPQLMQYIEQVSIKCNVPIIDLYSRTKNMESSKYYIDGLHPNKEGAKIIAGIIYDFLAANGYSPDSPSRMKK